MIAAPGLGSQLTPTHEIEDLRLDGHIERGRRLVGDEQLRIASERDGNHRTLPHAARQIVRVLVEAVFRGTEILTRSKKLDSLVPRLLRRQTAMADKDLSDLIAYRKTWVERRHRLLKNHRQPVAAQIAHFVVRQAEQIAAVEQYRAVHFRVLRQQAHQRECRYALAATGFADDTERGPERKTFRST